MTLLDILADNSREVLASSTPGPILKQSHKESTSLYLLALFFSVLTSVSGRFYILKTKMTIYSSRLAFHKLVARIINNSGKSWGCLSSDQLGSCTHPEPIIVASKLNMPIIQVLSCSIPHKPFG